MLNPSKIVCVGRNYVKHIEELGNEMPEQMVVFNKPASAISTSLQAHSDEPHHFEAELCFEIQGGKLAKVGLGLDLTKRQLQSYLKSKGLPWERAKAFDGSAVFSQFITLPENWQALTFELKINGQTRQLGEIGLMIYSPEIILEQVNSFMTLEDGDVIMTGTPEGVGVVNPGDVFELMLHLGNQTLLAQMWTAK